MSETKEFLPAPTTLNEVRERALVYAKSGLVPKFYENKPEAIIVAMEWSHNLGIPAIQGLQYIAVINGKPSMYGDGLISIVMASGLCEDIKESVSGEGNNAVAICEVKRKGFTSPTVRTFSMKQAAQAGLLSKVGPWKQYPERMLAMRARAYALRDAFPDVLSGMRSAEEERDAAFAEADATFAAEEQEQAVKPAPKRPRRKVPAKTEPKAETVTDVEPVEPVEEQAAPVEPAHDEIEAVAEKLNDSAEIINRIMACENYDAMLLLWGTLSDESKKDTAIRNAFVEHGKEVKKEA